MEKINFKLETFEGPLDLLLSLIEKNKIDIYDIEIFLLAEQYMEYISLAEKYDISLAADFIEMASQLMYIKSCSLLPKQEDEEDPKAMLEAMLQEYAKYKKVSKILKEKYIGNLIFFREEIPADLPALSNETPTNISLLVEAYDRVLMRNERKKPVPMSTFKKIVASKFVTVSSKIVFVLKKLFKGGKTSLYGLFRGSDGRSEIVATFLAVLELVRHGRIDIKDTDTEDTEIVLNKNVRNIKGEISDGFDQP